MKKPLFAAFLIGFLTLPMSVWAIPTSWDYASGVLQPLFSQRGAELKVSHLTATSTSQSTFAGAVRLNATLLDNDGDVGTSGQILSSTGSGLNWITNSGGGGGGGGLATSTAIADTYVIYGTSALDVGAESEFTYDDATNKLTVSYASTTAITATTLYGALVGNANTATALASNGANCSVGNAPLGVDASGAVESCFDVWTEAENTAAAYLSTVDISDNTNLTGDAEIVLTGDALSIAASIARDSELHNAVTLAGEDFLSLSTQLITANAINPDNLAATDFGDFTCNGTTCSFDTGTVAASEILDDTVALDDIAHTLTLAGNPALATGQCFWASTGIICEGSTVNTSETLLTFTNPTSDRTITFPDASITVAGLSSAMTGTFDGNNFGGGDIGLNEMLYGSSAGTLGEVAAGTSGQLLQANGSGVPTFVSMSGDATIVAGGAITIAANAIEESMLKAVDTAADEECLTYETTTGDFEWQECGTGGGGGAAGGVSTTSDLLGNNVLAETITYSTNDFMIGGSATTSAVFLFDPESATFEIATTVAATTSILSTDGTEAVRIGEGDQSGFVWGIGEGIEFDFGTAGDIIVRAVGSVTEWVSDLIYTFTGTVNFGSATVTGLPYTKTFIASSSAMVAATTTLPLGTAFNAQTWDTVECYTYPSGLADIRFGDGTNWMTFIKGASTTVGRYTVSSNNTFTAGEKIFVEASTTVSGAIPSCTISYQDN